MQRTRAAIYIQAPDLHSYISSVADIKGQIIKNGCKLANQECIYGDTNDNLAGLKALVAHSDNHDFQVVYVAHNFLPNDQSLYRQLVDQLYSKGISVLLV